MPCVKCKRRAEVHRAAVEEYVVDCTNRLKEVKAAKDSKGEQEFS